MKTRILLGFSLLLLLAACGPLPTAPAIAQDSACSKTHPSTKTPTWGLSYIVSGSADFKTQVYCILEDDRSWIGIRPAGVGMTPDFTIELVNATQAIELCKPDYKTELENSRVSCETDKFIYINENRWALGIDWRILVVNHEVGHRLGYDHDYGAPCSVMHDAGCSVHPGAIWPPIQDRKVLG